MKYDDVSSGRNSFFFFFLKKKTSSSFRGGVCVYICVVEQERGLGRKATTAQTDRSIRLIASAGDERKGNSRSGYVGIGSLRKKSIFGEIQKEG